MRVLVFGTYDTRSHPRVGVLADGLRAQGFVVRECNAPLNISTAQRVAALRQPWRVPWLAAKLLQRWATLMSASRSFRGPNRPDVVLVGYLGHFDVLLAHRLFPRSRIVLDHLINAADTGRDRGESGSVKQFVLRLIDRTALHAADVVVVDTEEHRQTLTPAARTTAVVVAVGAPDAWFSPPSLASKGELRVVFFGLFTPLQGAPVVGEALRIAGEQLTGVRLRATLVGHGQDLAATRAAADGANIDWLDWVTSDELPALIAGHDVCLGIFGTGPKALRVVPNKVFQGAAAGCAIVTSDTAPQRRALGDAAIFVRPGDAGALAAALIGLATDPEQLADYRQRASARAREAFSARSIVEPLLAHLRGSDA